MNQAISDLLAQHTSSLPWMEKSLVVFMRAGSHAYGLNIEGSDEDYRGICIPPLNYSFGFLERFEQLVVKKPADITIFELRKFMGLATDCNPNMIELLFTDDSDILFMSKSMERLYEHRDKFLSKVAKHRFSGYAFSQLKRMKHHHAMHSNPPKAPPTRAEYGLPERTLIPADQLAAAQSAIAKKLSHWNLTDLHDLEPSTRIVIQSIMADILAEMQVSADESWKGAARSIGYDENFIRLLDMERQYTAKQKQWESFQVWKKERNEKRAELEAKHGFDTKHGVHLVRLIKMCREILATGKVIVKRPDREELLAIRNGAWPYEKLIEWADNQEKELIELYKTSELPNEPDRKFLNHLCFEIISEFHGVRYDKHDQRRLFG